MTIDKAQLKALSDRVTTNRRFCADEYHCELAAGIMALLAEIERLEVVAQNEISMASERAREVCGARMELYGLTSERDQLKAENDALRKDAERYRWLRDKQTFIWLIQDWFPGEAMLTNVDADIDAAMAREASHG